MLQSYKLILVLTQRYIINVIKNQTVQRGKDGLFIKTYQVHCISMWEKMNLDFLPHTIQKQKQTKTPTELNGKGKIKVLMEIIGKYNHKLG